MPTKRLLKRETVEVCTLVFLFEGGGGDISLLHISCKEFPTCIVSPAQNNLRVMLHVRNT